MDYDVFERVFNVILGLLKRSDKYEKLRKSKSCNIQLIEKKEHEITKKIWESNFKFLYGFGFGVVFAVLGMSIWIMSGLVNEVKGYSS